VDNFLRYGIITVQEFDIMTVGQSGNSLVYESRVYDREDVLPVLFLDFAFWNGGLWDFVVGVAGRPSGVLPMDWDDVFCGTVNSRRFFRRPVGQIN
jgi:hypothetical protein